MTDFFIDWKKLMIKLFIGDVQIQNLNVKLSEIDAFERYADYLLSTCVSSDSKFPPDLLASTPIEGSVL